MRMTVCLMLLLVASACGQRELAPGVSDSAFVRTMAALRRLQPGATDSVARARSRDSILRAHGITAQQLEAATLSLASDPARASNLFRAIENRPLEPDPSPVRSVKKDGATK